MHTVRIETTVDERGEVHLTKLPFPVHPNVAKPVVISGNPGDDARHYQVRAVELAIEESKK